MVTNSLIYSTWIPQFGAKMHFVVCIKQVPDTAEVKIDPETNTLVRAGVESIANPYDVTALEEAVRLKEKYGGKVTAISMGPPQADSVLRQAFSLGADDIVLLSDRAFAGADTLATSYTLSRAIETLGKAKPVDLVLCGNRLSMAIPLKPGRALPPGSASLSLPT